LLQTQNRHTKAWRSWMCIRFDNGQNGNETVSQLLTLDIIAQIWPYSRSRRGELPCCIAACWLVW